MTRRLWRRLLIIIAVLGGTHAYIWWRFVAEAELAAPWRTAATVAICVFAPSFPLAVLGTREAIADRGRMIGDYLLALEETRPAR